MKLEVGKFYKTRDGRKVHFAFHPAYQGLYGLFEDGSYGEWDLTGVNVLHPSPSGFDVIAEWYSPTTTLPINSNTNQPYKTASGEWTLQEIFDEVGKFPFRAYRTAYPHLPPTKFVGIKKLFGLPSFRYIHDPTNEENGYELKKLEGWTLIDPLLAMSTTPPKSSAAPPKKSFNEPEPSCTCESPQVHDRACSWIRWKEKKDRFEMTAHELFFKGDK